MPRATAAPTAVPPARVVPPKVAPGVSARWVVYDRRTKKILSQRSPKATIRSASVVKLLIAVDYLERHGGRVAAADARAFGLMLRSSDDKAATRFWNLGGKGKIITRMRKRIPLAQSAPPPAAQPGFWGYTAISALDIAKAYRYLEEKATPATRKVVLGHLRTSTPCGTDGFDQSFGIPSAVKRPWAVKQGWSGFGNTPPYACRATAQGASFTPVAGPDLGLGRPVLHTTGVIGAGDRYIVVVLTLNPAGASYRTSVQRITKLAKGLTKGLA
ncbi:hypothetical protein GCM10010468_41010 [Actinocorallia longicatena]|uniref:Beta-lactamase family protein n=1 Tax=Actinocorallia longicatena TaxID=111803 RepID=A0ABP6QHN1_9ACTN